jgi:hypothetical protein
MDKRIAEATGFGYEWVDFKGAEGAWELIKETVDSGRSAKGWDWENILFAGYQDADTPEGRRVFAMADGPETFAEWLTWSKLSEYIDRILNWGCPRFGRHTGRVETMHAAQVALRVMKDLVEWSIDPPEKIAKAYPRATFGLAGIEKYAADCANTDEYEDWGACHDINPQWTIRNSTAVYLERVTADSVFPATVTGCIAAAAREYRAAYADWKELYAQLGHNAPQGAGKVRERRLAVAQAIRDALDHEKAALAELREAIGMAEGRTES